MEFYSIEFFVPGNPIALKRHRMTKTGFAYDPSKGDKSDFLAKCIQHKPEKPIDGPVRLQLRFQFPRPKSHYRTGKNAGIIKSDAPKYQISRPDLDNLVKFVADSLNGIFWKDDAQICHVYMVKVYSDNPGLEIKIYTTV